MTGAHAAVKTSTVPFVQARNYHPGRIKPVVLNSTPTRRSDGR